MRVDEWDRWIVQATQELDQLHAHARESYRRSIRVYRWARWVYAACLLLEVGAMIVFLALGKSTWFQLGATAFVAAMWWVSERRLKRLLEQGEP